MGRDGAEQRRMDSASVGNGKDLGLSVACVAIVGPAQVVAQSQIEELSVLDAMLDVNLTLNTGVVAIIR
jgi:hypothetical protein